MSNKVNGIDFSAVRFERAYIDTNRVHGGNRTGYPVASDAFAIVVKGLEWINGIGDEIALEIAHQDRAGKLAKWSQETGLPIGHP